MAPQIKRIDIVTRLVGIGELEKIKSSFRDLGKVTNMTNDELKTARDELIAFASGARQSDNLIKGLISAYEGLAGEAEHCSDIHRELIRDINGLKDVQRGATIEVENQAKALIRLATSGRQSAESLRGHITQLEALIAQTRVGSTANVALSESLAKLRGDLSTLTATIEATTAAEKELASAPDSRNPERFAEQIRIRRRELESLEITSEKYKTTLASIIASENQYAQAAQQVNRNIAAIAQNRQALSSNASKAFNNEIDTGAIMARSGDIDTLANRRAALSDLVAQLQNVEIGDKSLDAIRQQKGLEVDYNKLLEERQQIRKQLTNDILGATRSLANAEKDVQNILKGITPEMEQQERLAEGMLRRQEKLAKISAYSLEAGARPGYRRDVFSPSAPLALPGSGGTSSPDTGSLIGGGARQIRERMRPQAILSEGGTFIAPGAGSRVDLKAFQQAQADAMRQILDSLAGAMRPQLALPAAGQTTSKYTGMDMSPGTMRRRVIPDDADYSVGSMRQAARDYANAQQSRQSSTTSPEPSQRRPIPTDKPDPRLVELSSARQLSTQALLKEKEKIEKLLLTMDRSMATANAIDKAQRRSLTKIDDELERRSPRGMQGRVGYYGQAFGAIAAGGIFGGPLGAAGSAIGAAVGNKLDGPAGAAAGAFAGASAGAYAQMLAQAISSTTDYSAQISKLQIGLKGVTGTQGEYQAALAATSRVTDEFNIPLLDSTRGFTKLLASVKGAGGNIGDTELVFRNVSAAVKATGGSSEEAQGAMLAMSQIFSKGKVSAEELNQIGERLPGTFGKFAKANKMLGPELSEGLKQGKVGLNELMKFITQLGIDYEATAKKMAKGPEEAGARLTVAFDKFRNDLGKQLMPIGAMIQDSLTGALTDLQPVIQSLVKSIVSIARSLIGIGSAVLQALDPAIKAITAITVLSVKAIAKILEFGRSFLPASKAAKALADIIQVAGAAMIAFFAVSKGGAAFDLIKAGFTGIKDAIVATSKATWGAVVASKAFLAANPWALIIAGVVAATVALYKFNAGFKATIDSIGQSIKNLVNSIINYSGPLSKVPIFGLLQRILGFGKDTAAQIASSAGAAVNAAKAGMGDLVPLTANFAGPADDSEEKENKKREKELLKQERDAATLADQQQALAVASANAAIEQADRVFRHQIELDRKRYDLAMQLYNLQAENEIDKIQGGGKEAARAINQYILDQRSVQENLREARVNVVSKKQDEINASSRAAVAAMAPATTGGSAAIGSFASLSRLIGSRESYGGDYGAFNRGGSNNGHDPHGSGTDPNLINMTIAEIQRRQLAPDVPSSQWLHAVGKYQIIGKTLQSLLAGKYGDTGVKATDRFTPEVQELLGAALAKARIVPGSVNETMRGLRSEWVGLQKVRDADLLPAVKELMSGRASTPQTGARVAQVKASIAAEGKMGVEALDTKLAIDQEKLVKDTAPKFDAAYMEKFYLSVTRQYREQNYELDKTNALLDEKTEFLRDGMSVSRADLEIQIRTLEIQRNEAITAIESSKAKLGEAKAQEAINRIFKESDATFAKMRENRDSMFAASAAEEQSQAQAALRAQAFEASLGRAATNVEKWQYQISVFQESGGFISSDAIHDLISTAEETDKLNKNLEKLIEYQKTLQDGDTFKGLRQGAISYVESIGTIKEATAQLTTNAIKGLEDQIFSLATTGTATFKQFANSIIQDITRIIIRQFVLRSIMKVVGLISGGPPQIPGLPLDGFNTAISGGLDIPGFSSSSISLPSGAFGAGSAKGNVLSGPASGYLSLLHGNEAVMPIVRGSDGNLGVGVTANGNAKNSPNNVNNITINVDVSSGETSVTADGEQQGKELAMVVAQVVRQEMINQSRPGGALSRGRR